MLNFKEIKDDEGKVIQYSVINDKQEHIANIQYERTGRFMHWVLAINKYHFGNQDYLIFGSGCQDEIRDFCRKLNGKKLR